MHPIRLNHATGVPVFQQIVEQITYMIETGQLDDGDQLPSSRMLADNLHVNRNTVARAYGELRQAGLVSSQGRRGMVVRDSGRARERMAARESAHTVLAGAVARCLELGLAARGDRVARLPAEPAREAHRGAARVRRVQPRARRRARRRAVGGDRDADPAARPRRDRAGRRAGRRPRRHDLLPPGRGPQLVRELAPGRAAGGPRDRDRPARADARAAQPDPARRADRDLLHDRGAGARDPAVARRHGLRRGRRDHRPRRSRRSPAAPS